MLAQAAVQPTVSVQKPTQAQAVRMTMKQVKPAVVEMEKPKAEEKAPRYDFVGIAG